MICFLKSQNYHKKKLKRIKERSHVPLGLAHLEGLARGHIFLMFALKFFEKKISQNIM